MLTKERLDKIISCLNKDFRMPASKISKLTGIPVGTITHNFVQIKRDYKIFVVQKGLKISVEDLKNIEGRIDELNERANYLDLRTAEIFLDAKRAALKKFHKTLLD